MIDLFSSRHCFKILAYSSKNKSLRACASSPLEPDGKYKKQYEQGVTDLNQSAVIKRPCESANSKPKPFCTETKGKRL
jgi:hypothetical protein